MVVWTDVQDFCWDEKQVIEGFISSTMNKTAEDTEFCSSTMKSGLWIEGMTIMPTVHCFHSNIPTSSILDRSMTILKQPSKIVIDRSMTVLEGSTPCGDVHLYKIVIDQSMTILKQPSKNVIDWSMTVLEGSIPCGDVHLYKIVIDRSMTILKQPSKNVKMSLTGQ